MTSHLIDRFHRRTQALSAPPRPSPPTSGYPASSAGDAAGPGGQYTEGCTFCSIASEQEPAFIVYEDDSSLAFLDILPIRPGHLLLVPKQHYERVPHLPDELSAHLGAVLPKLCRALCRATDQPDFNIVSNQGYAQVVPHVHYHIVPAPRLDQPKPRSRESSPSSGHPAAAKPAPQFRLLGGRSELDEDEAAALAQRVKEELEKEARGEPGRRDAKL